MSPISVRPSNLPPHGSTPSASIFRSFSRRAASCPPLLSLLPRWLGSSVISNGHGQRSHWFDIKRKRGEILVPQHRSSTVNAPLSSNPSQGPVHSARKNRTRPSTNRMGG